MTRALCFLLVAPVLLTGLSCSDEGKAERAKKSHAAAKDAAEAYFSSLTTPTPEKASPAGLTAVHIGWHKTKVEAATQGDPPVAYRATIVYSCLGRRPDGKPGSVRRTLTLTLFRGPGDSYHVTSHDFRPDQPLAFWRQTGSWLLTSYSVPLLVLSCIVAAVFFISGQLWSGVSDIFFNPGVLFLVLGGVFLFAVVWSGIAAYDEFGPSPLAVILALLAFVVLTAVAAVVGVSGFTMVAAIVARARGKDPKEVSAYMVVMVFVVLAIVGMAFLCGGGLGN